MQSVLLCCMRTTHTYTFQLENSQWETASRSFRPLSLKLCSYQPSCRLLPCVAVSLSPPFWSARVDQAAVPIMGRRKRERQFRNCTALFDSHPISCDVSGRADETFTAVAALSSSFAPLPHFLHVTFRVLKSLQVCSFSGLLCSEMWRPCSRRRTMSTRCRTVVFVYCDC